jgi:hypothetical protein
MLAPLALASAALFAMGCGRSDAERQQQVQATAAAEATAGQASLTSATLAAPTDDDAVDASSEMIATFRLEQADYRGRLQHGIDGVEQASASTHHVGAGDSARLRDLQARRDLLKADLDALERSTESDWAPTRAKIERDLDHANGAQLMPLAGARRR